MVVFPPCKINLGLNIVAKRKDGYHDIDTCFYPVPWTDVLEILPAEKLSMETTGISIPGNSDENICIKAYQLVAKDVDLPPVKIHLHKIVPIGAGLGGGSSDGAQTLKILNSIFDLKVDKEGLKKYASQLGSDCAFFIDTLPALGTGKGDELTPLQVDLSGKYLVVIKPAIHVSTAEAYANVNPFKWSSSVQEILTHKPVEQWKDVLLNDFEKSVFIRYPEIESLKNNMYKAGAVYASMSGSGSSVFGIFESEIPPSLISERGTHWSGWL